MCAICKAAKRTNGSVLKNPKFDWLCGQTDHVRTTVRTISELMTGRTQDRTGTSTIPRPGTGT